MPFFDPLCFKGDFFLKGETPPPPKRVVFGTFLGFRFLGVFRPLERPIEKREPTVIAGPLVSRGPLRTSSLLRTKDHNKKMTKNRVYNSSLSSRPPSRRIKQDFVRIPLYRRHSRSSTPHQSPVSPPPPPPPPPSPLYINAKNAKKVPLEAYPFKPVL